MKRSFFILALALLWSLSSCNLYKVVPPGKQLLRKNKINYTQKEIIKPSQLDPYILQHPNFYIFGYPVLVGIYSIADPYPDSTFVRFINRHPGFRRTFVRIFSEKQLYQLRLYYIGLNKEIQSFGQKPVIIDTAKTAKSARNLHFVFKNKGFLLNRTAWEVVPVRKLYADVWYRIREGERFYIDTVRHELKSPVVRRLFQDIRPRLQVEPGKPYDRDYIIHDRDLITRHLRNHGLYDFQLSHIRYDVIYDTVPKPYVNIRMLIGNRLIQQGDTLIEKPFVPYHYDTVSVMTLKNFREDRKHFDRVVRDSLYVFYYPATVYFRPDLLKKSLFIRPGALYSDQNVDRTRTQLMHLQNFRQVYITHTPHDDSLLTARIALIPLKKYEWDASLNITRSNIRPLGLNFETSLTWHNVFHGFENLSLSYYSLWASSVRFSHTQNRFEFNVREWGIDLHLRIPRITAPFIQRWIPMFMQPQTDFGLRYLTQTNIGLDREKIYMRYGYEWKPNRHVTNKFRPLEINYVNYKNPSQYFRLYTSAFNTLRQIALQYYQRNITPEEADAFIRYVLENEPPDSEIYREVSRIYERKTRLTENVLIISSNYSAVFDSRKDLLDSDYTLIKGYTSLAGWLPSAVSKVMRLPVNQVGQEMINKVPYAQFWKGEFTFIRHWDLGKNHIMAYRFFGGIAIPFGNSKNIPFVEAYYAGGSSDIRAWRAFELGPGSTGGIGEFNEANFKLMSNWEYRFPIKDAHRGAVFVDAGNIWNVFDDIPYEEAKFKGWSSLRDIAVGAGFGYRYDFGFFALRLDYAFKIYDPALPLDQRWRKPRLDKGTLQIGINYPF